MFKKIFLACLAVMLIPVKIPATSYAVGISYYVDSVNGNDQNTGMSPLAPWESLDKINNTVFSAGDQIFLKSGSVWSNTFLYLRGSGTAQNPIKVDMYGGSIRPVIHTNGVSSESIRLKYNKCWEISNIEVTNYTAETGRYRRGVYVESGDTEQLEHIYLRNLYIHDVNGDLSDRYNGGIIIRAYSATKNVCYNDVLIENCSIFNVDRDGIRFVGQTDYKSKDVVIRNNFVNNIGGDGIVNVGTEGALVEHNIAKDCNIRGDKACVAIWCYGADNTVLQYNEAYLTHNTKDGQGYDCDYNSKGTIFQYNYSHDNEGGFVLVCNDPSVPTNYNDGSIVRYNISQNDRKRVFMLSGNPTNTHFYNNTVYVGANLSTAIVGSWDWNGGWADNTRFTNNIIYNLGSGGYEFGSTTNNLFEYNVFYGNHPASEPADNYKITTDPQFFNPGGAVDGIDTARAYKIMGTSPCIDSGKSIENNGGKDFFGNPLEDSFADRGACEYKTPYIKAVTFTDGRNSLESVRGAASLYAAVAVENAEELIRNNCLLVIAVYDKNNRLIKMNKRPVDDYELSIFAENIPENQSEYVKFFVFDNLEHIQPICASKRFD